MNSKFSIIFVLFYALPILLSGQKNYYATKNEISYGVYLIKGNDIQNSKFCHVIKDNEYIKLLPDEILEYGFKDGSVYFSKEIFLSNVYKQVFLERLVKGPINLYYFKDEKYKTFFIENDDKILIELPKHTSDNRKENFKSALSGLTPPCLNKSETFKLVTYSKKSLAQYVECLNNCDSRFFQFIKLGLYAGYGFTKLSPTNRRPSYLNFDVFKFNYNGSFNAGLFVDIPIIKTNVSLHFETSYSKNKIFDYQKINDNEYEMTLTYSSLSFPLLIRYTYPYANISPYINIGPIYSCNFKNSNSIYELVGNVFHDFSNYYEIIPDNLVGYSIGVGIQKKITFRNFLFTELRFNKLYGLYSYEFVNKGEINIMLGINF